MNCYSPVTGEVPFMFVGEPFESDSAGDSLSLDECVELLRKRHTDIEFELVASSMMGSILRVTGDIVPVLKWVIEYFEECDADDVLQTVACFKMVEED